MNIVEALDIEIWAMIIGGLTVALVFVLRAIWGKDL